MWKAFGSHLSQIWKASGTCGELYWGIWEAARDREAHFQGCSGGMNSRPGCKVSHLVVK